MRQSGKIGKGVMFGNIVKRFSRQIALPEFGLVGQDRLSASHVLIVGAGGLGNAVIPALAAGGVGKITVIDDDKVSVSNLARQIVFGYHDVGKYKAKVLAERLNHQYKQEVVFPVIDRVSTHNVDILINHVDVLIDGCDNFETRYLLADSSQRKGIPLITGALGPYDGQIFVFGPEQERHYRSVFPEPSDQAACSITGVWSPLVAMVGSIMVSETIKLISGVGESLIGKMMLIDSFNNQVQVIRVQPEVPTDKKMSAVGRISMRTLGEWQKNEDLLLVDVQEPYEFAEKSLAELNISVYDLPKKWPTVLAQEPRKIVFICPNGVRSKIAYLWSRDKNENCYYVGM